MTVSCAQRKCLAALRRCFQELGYTGALLEEDYQFTDWFSRKGQAVRADLAAFGQTPPSYATACLAAATSNGRSGIELARCLRSLGAPMAFEVGEDLVVPWRLRAALTAADRLEPFRHDQISTAFFCNAQRWCPSSILRAKNIGPGAPRQLDFVDLGLVPALEESIRQRLDPLLGRSLHVATEVYVGSTGRRPRERQLFRAAFWLLAGKVFHDRRHAKFLNLCSHSPADEVLARVGAHYGQRMSRALLNREARQALHQAIWESINFTNLSVEVLAEIWANTFVTPDLRRRLGIHSTPRAVARFIVDHIPFEDIDFTEGYVVEPCCGSARFLIAALQRLRMLLPPDWSGARRHKYFTRRLVGFDMDPFGIEISRLGLTLADYPNPDGWRLRAQDVFTSREFEKVIRKARVVLCNPPFEDLDRARCEKYGAATPRQPAELLSRVCGSLHPEGHLGFVLPRKFLDGRSYRRIRQSIVRRFSQLELVSLPDNAFEHADADTLLLIAKAPRKGNGPALVRHLKVSESGWEAFKSAYEVTREDCAQLSSDEAAASVAVPDLQGIWDKLRSLPRLGDSARIHRGIEWNRPIAASRRAGVTAEAAAENYAELVRDKPADGFVPGIAPKSKITPFVQPEVRYLSVHPADARGNAFRREWSAQKVILNKTRRTRGKWRLASFADEVGLACYQTFIAIWPQAADLDVELLAAILNGPVANAFVAAHEHGRDITKGVLQALPLPEATSALKLGVTTGLYDFREGLGREDGDAAWRAILSIDREVTRAYGLSADEEKALIRYFAGSARPLPLGMLREGYLPDSLDEGVTFDELIAITSGWASTNDERCKLIQKDVYDGLGQADKARLASLQRLADMRLRAFAPISTEALDKLLEDLDE